MKHKSKVFRAPALLTHSRSEHEPQHGERGSAHGNRRGPAGDAMAHWNDEAAHDLRIHRREHDQPHDRDGTTPLITALQ